MDPWMTMERGYVNQLAKLAIWEDWQRRNRALQQRQKALGLTTAPERAASSSSPSGSPMTES